MIRLLALLLLLLIPAASFAFTNAEISNSIDTVKARPVGDRLVYWAEKFVGTPYDPDPMGDYVSRKAIVADERVDCMYHVFRSVELALSSTPEEAVEMALDKRFITRGKLAPDGTVLNYDERYQYGADMIDGGKWGKEVTAEIGPVTTIEGARGRETVDILRKATLITLLKDDDPTFQNGDIVFFIKYPEKRVVGEIVGHMGVLKIDHGRVYLIHASGRKNGKGKVVEVPFSVYLGSMPFMGIRVVRFH